MPTNDGITESEQKTKYEADISTLIPSNEEGSFNSNPSHMTNAIVWLFSVSFSKLIIFFH